MDEFHSRVLRVSGRAESACIIPRPVRRQQQRYYGIHDPHLYLALTEVSMDGLAIHDAEGLFIYLYAAHAQNLGYEGLGELIGKN